MKNQHPLDKLIRERIAELPERPPQDWAALERKLEAVSISDGLLAAKLTALSPTPPMGSWESLERKISAAEQAAAESVDQVVTEALHGAAPAVVSGWAQLAARLELTGKRREMVACMKITESVVLLSLIIVLLRVAGIGNGQTAKIADLVVDRGTAFPMEIEMAGTEAVVAELTVTDADEAVIPTRKTIVTATLPNVAGNNPTSLNHHGLLDHLTVRIAPDGLETLAGTSLAPLTRDWGVRPALDLAPVLFGQPVNYSLDFFVSPVDINQVVTKGDQRYGVSDTANYSTGFSGGLLVNIDQGKNALQTGLIYGYRAYAPAEILLIEGVQVVKDGEDPIRYGRLKYRTVSIPLTYERQLLENDKWRLSGGLGVAMNVILSSNFALNENYNEKDLKRAWDDYIYESGTDAIGRGSKDRDFFDPADGYLEGGSLIENSSLYVNGHFTVERFVTDRWSLYFSPTVSRLVTVRDDDGGKGPLGDRIHNTMLRFGARVKITDN